MGERPKETPQPGGQQDEPQNGEKSPTKPAEGMPNGTANPDDAANPNDPKNGIPGWMTSLPPEIRDALVGGNAEAIPARYRDLIRRYTRWLQEQSNRNGR